jgi:hypothetical protein
MAQHVTAADSYLPAHVCSVVCVRLQREEELVSESLCAPPQVLAHGLASCCRRTPLRSQAGEHHVHTLVSLNDTYF